MDHQALELILQEAYMRYERNGNGRAIQFAAKRLPTLFFTGQTTLPGSHNFELCRYTLQNSNAAILSADENTAVLLALVYSGGRNMNPAVLAVEVDGERITATAGAKEGLIKQGTAKKAVTAFLDLLGRTLCDFY